MGSPFDRVSVDVQEAPSASSIQALEALLKNSQRLYTDHPALHMLVMNPDTNERMEVRFHPRSIERNVRKAPIFMQGTLVGFSGEFDLRLRLTRRETTDFGTLEVSGEL